MATIRITDLTLKAIIGTNAWERKIRQTVVINVTFHYNASKAASTDSIKDAVDYKAITKEIIALVKKSRHFLLERLAHSILKLVMKDTRIKQASVRVDKPKALRFAKSVSVESHVKR